jgi:hypothetical protein
MSKNKYGPQVWVLPEDDANRQIAVGFTLEASVKSRNIEVLPVAGGWTAIRDSFENHYNNDLQKHPHCLMVLLVDFDNQGARRLESVLSVVDSSLKNRVFVLGALDEPERLKAALKIPSYEKIGRALAKECSNATLTTWEHSLLSHNRPELTRMAPHVRPILFADRAALVPSSTPQSLRPAPRH